MNTMLGLATNSTAMVRRLRCSTLKPSTPGAPTCLQSAQASDLLCNALSLSTMQARPDSCASPSSFASAPDRIWCRAHVYEPSWQCLASNDPHIASLSPMHSSMLGHPAFGAGSLCIGSCIMQNDQHGNHRGPTRALRLGCSSTRSMTSSTKACMAALPGWPLNRRSAENCSASLTVVRGEWICTSPSSGTPR